MVEKACGSPEENRQRKNNLHGVDSDSFTSSASGSPPDVRNPTTQIPSPRGNPNYVYSNSDNQDETGFLNVEEEPLLGQSRNQTRQKTSARRVCNVAQALVGFLLAMLSYSIFTDIYNQWTRHHFDTIYGKNSTENSSTIGHLQCVTDSNTSTRLPRLPIQSEPARSKAEVFFLWSLLIELGPALFSCMLMGSFSNRTGRKLLFVLPTFGLIVRITVTITVLYWELHEHFLFIGLGISGLCGSVAGLLMAIYIYIADNIAVFSCRSKAMVIAQVVSSICLAVPLIGVDYFVTAEDYIWPMTVSLGLAVAAFLWFLCFLNDTVRKTSFRDCSERLEALRSVFSFYFTKSSDILYNRCEFVILGLVFFLFGSCFGTDFLLTYLTIPPICWFPVNAEIIIILQSVIQGIGALIITPVLQKLVMDEHICVFGLFFGAISRAVFASAVKNSMLYAAFFLGICDQIVLPLIRSILSRMVSDDNRGPIFASMAIIEVLSMAASSAGLRTLFFFTVETFHNLSFVVMAAILIIAALLMGIQAGISRTRGGSALRTVVVYQVVDSQSTKKKSSEVSNYGAANYGTVNYDAPGGSENTTNTARPHI